MKLEILSPSLNISVGDRIKTALRTHFAYLSNKDILTRQLENLRQEKDESSTKCINQIRTISKRYDKKD